MNGADIRPPDLREELPQCERRRQMHDMCGVRYIGLRKDFPRKNVGGGA